MAKKKEKSTKKAGKVRKKRKDTHIGTIEKIYGQDYGVRTDMMHLSTYLEKNGYKSLSELLKNGKGKTKNNRT